MSSPNNILMVVCDQERYDLLGSNGGNLCFTPNLDLFAAESLRFTQAYTPTGICSPTRASMLTGVYPHTHGMMNNCHGDDALQTELPPDFMTYPKYLNQHGYRLGYVGKWHVGKHLGPESQGFHDVYGEAYDVAAATGALAVKNPRYVQFAHDTMLASGILDGPIEQTESHVLADATIDLLHQYRHLNQPFFLRLDFPGPHHPYVAPAQYASQYDPQTIPPWPNFPDPFSKKPPNHARQLNHRGVEHWSWADWQPLVALYFAAMTHIDAEIGRVLATVKELGLWDETLIIHTADHGDMTGSHGMFNKGPQMYEEVYHIPLLIRDPKRTKPSTISQAMVRSMDLMPTLLEYAGIAVPDGLQARSFLSLLSEPDKDFLPEIFAEYHGDEWGLYSARMIKTKEHKFVYNPQANDELYDLSKDPYELHNVIDEPCYQDIRLDLERRLSHYLQETKDPLARWSLKVLG